MPVQVVATREEGASGSSPAIFSFIRPAYTGLSYGKATTTVDAPITRGTGAYDEINVNLVNSLIRVSPTQGDTFYVYEKDVDYELTAPNKITWLGNNVPPPDFQIDQIEGDGESENFPVGSYTFKMTCLDNNDNETLPSSPLTVVITEDTKDDIMVITWGVVPFASAYKLYLISAPLGVTTGVYSFTEIGNATQVSLDFVDGAFSAGTPPVTSNAVVKPTTGTTYYVTYTTRAINTEPKKYSNIAEVEQDHGYGSNLTNMARLALQTVGVPEIWLCATFEDTVAAHQAALSKFNNKDCNYLVPLKTSQSLARYSINLADYLSQDLKQQERQAVVGIPNSITTVGHASTPNTILYWLESFGHNKRGIIPVSNGNKVYADIWQTVDGAFNEEVLVDNWVLAGVYAAMRCVAEDVATSITNRIVPGLTYGVTGGPWDDSVVKLQVEAAGGAYILDNNRSLRIYHDISNDVGTTEDMENCIVAAEDELRRRVRRRLDIYKGLKYISTRKNAIYQTVIDELRIAVRDGIINGYSEPIGVEQDATTKTRVNIRAKYIPVYPINELWFIYSFDLTTVI